MMLGDVQICASSLHWTLFCAAHTVLVHNRRGKEESRSRNVSPTTAARRFLRGLIPYAQAHAFANKVRATDFGFRTRRVQSPLVRTTRTVQRWCPGFRPT